jgi:MarR family transcriptional regulator, organic hydroperoxide resistance regulator
MRENIFHGGKPEASTGYLLWQIVSLRQRKINAELTGIDLTYPQFVVLSGIHWLKQDNEIVNQVQLINFTKMDKSVISSVLKLLEKKEIVIRETNPQDTRAKTLDLSKTGLNKLEKAWAIIKQVDLEFFDKTVINIDDLNELLFIILNKNEYQ